MAFVKLDTGILRSTIWFDKPARDVFLTALLMAEPREYEEPVPQIQIRNLDETGWSAPPGWYGYVPASGPGLIHAAGVSQDVGEDALERLGSPESTSRSQDFDGRRLIRVDGGYIVLNYDRYRQKDHTTAERSKRYRERKRHTVTPITSRVTTRGVTHADADADAENGSTEAPPLPPAPEQRAEDATRKTITTLQIDLARLLTALEEHPNSRRRLTDWCREVTSYDKTDGTRVKGRADFRTIQSIDHLEKSISDAQWWLEELEGGRVVGADVLVREAQRGEG